MAGKRKTNKRMNDRPAAPPAPAYPSWDNPDEALGIWKNKIAQGYHPFALDEALKAVPPEISGSPAVRSLTRLAGFRLSPSGMRGPGWKPSSVMLDRDHGRLYFAGASGEGIGCYEATSGKALWDLPGGTLGWAGGMALGPEGLYVCDRWRHRVMVLDPDSGRERAVIERSAQGRPLNEPSDVTVLERDGKTEIWVCERGNHRICRLSPENGLIGYLGTRGMMFEEAAQRFTRPAGEPEALMFEFPESLQTGVDIDGERAVFVWDALNGRVVVLGADGSFRRVITLVPDGAAKFSGRVRVVSLPDGPIVLCLDNVNRSLNLHDHEGAPLLRVSLEDRDSDLTRARFACFVDCDGTPLVAFDDGRILEIDGPPDGIEGLIESLAVLFPEREDMVLSLAERKQKTGGTVRRNDTSGDFSPDSFVSALLDPGRALDRGLARNALRIENLARTSDRCSPAAESLRERLSALADEAFRSLLSLARPDETTLDSWSDALADLDMDLVQTKGRNQQKELELDDTLEEIREHPDLARRTAWTWRELTGILRSLGALDTASLAERLTREATSMLGERRELIRDLASRMDLGGDPGHIKRNELIALHRALLAVSSIERAASFLADCLLENAASGLSIPAEVRENISLCAQLDPASDKWRGLRSRLCPDEEASPRPSRSGPDELDEAGALEKMRSLVDSMTSYVKALNDVGGATGPFGRVVERQREIFAVKGSLLVNALFRNGDTSGEALELARRAGGLAGPAWGNTKNLRFAETAGEVR